MMAQNLFTIILLITAFICSPSIAETRIWTRTEDQKTLEAEYIDYDRKAGIVKIKIKRGQTFDLELKTLSNADQEWVEKQWATDNPPRIGVGEITSHNNESAEIGKWELYIPRDITEKESADKPLMLMFCPNGRPENLVKRMIPAADELGWTIVGIHAYSNKRNSAEGRNAAQEAMINDCKAILKQVQDTIPHHPDKVVIGGFSGAGYWSFQCSARLYPKTAGIISLGGWMSNNYRIDYPQKMKVAIVNGDKDEGARRSEEPDGDFLQKEKKATVKVFHFPGGHVAAPSDVLVEVATWLHAEAAF